MKIKKTTFRSLLINIYWLNLQVKLRFATHTAATDRWKRVRLCDYKLTIASCLIIPFRTVLSSSADRFIDNS